MFCSSSKQMNASVRAQEIGDGDSNITIGNVILARSFSPGISSYGPTQSLLHFTTFSYVEKEKPVLVQCHHMSSNKTS